MKMLEPISTLAWARKSTHQNWSIRNDLGSVSDLQKNYLFLFQGFCAHRISREIIGAVQACFIHFLTWILENLYD